MKARRYARCSDPDCRRRIMLPRWAKSELLNDPGAEWYCLDCSGETPRERMKWAEDALDETLENQDGAENEVHPDALFGLTSFLAL